jgi:peptidoglycan/xylan/chitin deacetylase (PgdA/CDA1 family)/CelD/BcsL family acetyltransferase involved in cellulose biosynthesis
MKVVEFHHESDLERLKPEWERLLCESASNTIFLTWEWMMAWWSAYGMPGELRILAALDEAGALRGIAPLRMQTKRKYGQTVSTLCFIGDGSNDSDYLDFIAAPGHERDIMEAFSAHLAKELNRGTILTLNEIPASSPNLRFLKNVADRQGLLWMENEVPCGTVRLPQSWEEFLASLKPRFRTKVRSVMRNLEDRPEVRQRFCQDAQEVERLLPILFDLHTRRWAGEGKPGVFRWDKKLCFYHDLSRRLLERGWLRFSRLDWKDRVLACQYGFVYAGVYWHLQEGYEPTSEHWNVGIGLRAWTVREFVREDIREYDFLGGVGRHKTDWGAEVKYSKQVLTTRESHRNRLFCRGPEWEGRFREIVNKVVPAKVLSVRRDYKRRANGAGLVNSGRGWLREAVAECYFRFHITSLARRVRDQYRLSIDPGAKRARFQRRNAPTGRILYYHRVNDDGDPFFPAISTALFEQQMRFVAGHYKVVSLTEMLARLDRGDPEQLMAITFDDGYRDNYQRAFPVLQRYGLPATIFLTTGVIDSREPLWFEQLALALKKTSQGYIELEIDIPRRIWMRTETERLKANARIYRLLRLCPDGERRQWLAEILRKVDVRSDERHGKMLTWSEIRSMQAHGIDFGGHTVTHPFISKLTPEQVTWEAAECKRRIEEEIQAPVAHFAYPSGREEDFGARNKELIRAAGYRAALTTIWGTNHSSTDPMELRRGGPWEGTPALFAYKLDWYELLDA